MELSLDKLTGEQKVALARIVSAIQSNSTKEIKLGGYAGCGKSVLVSFLRKFFPKFAVVAFTGKAANVLRRKGVDCASTIHSCIYEVVRENDNSTYWRRKYDTGFDGFIVDEASMVSSDIYYDLCLYNQPIIFVGDHGQLEPVDSQFNIMEFPDVTLEKIYRYAGDIAKFANRLREGFNHRGFVHETDEVQIINERQFDDDLMKHLALKGQVICAFNETRVNQNNRARELLGYKGDVQEGEKVVCLRNSKDYGVFNGMQGIVTKIYGKRKRSYMNMLVDGVEFFDIPFTRDAFGVPRPKIKFEKDAPVPYDWAYCCTGHKAQGDEWDEVGVLEERSTKWQHSRWAYTAGSRGKSKLYWRPSI